MKLYNAKFQYTQAGLFQLQLLFENEMGNKAGCVKSSLGATIRVGDTKEVIAQKLRDMADEVDDLLQRERDDKIDFDDQRNPVNRIDLVGG